MKILKSTNIKDLRNKWLKEQDFFDPISGMIIKTPNLDHCHSTGYCRGVLDREENAFLGKVENAYKRFLRHKGIHINDILRGTVYYLSNNKENEQILHPKSISQEIKKFSRYSSLIQKAILGSYKVKFSAIGKTSKERTKQYRNCLNKKENILIFK